MRRRKRGLYTKNGLKLPAAAGLPVSVIPTVAAWHVYMLRTGAGALYTGITTDPRRRLAEHSAGKAGARSLRGKGPLQLVWQCRVADRSTASRLEARLKRLSKADKERIVRGELSPQL